MLRAYQMGHHQRPALLQEVEVPSPHVLPAVKEAVLWGTAPRNSQPIPVGNTIQSINQEGGRPSHKVQLVSPYYHDVHKYGSSTCTTPTS